MELKTDTEIQEAELEVIRTAFQGNDNLLKLMRALFFGFEVTDEEKGVVKTAFANDELRRIIWKRFHPILHKDMPIGQLGDMWIGAQSMIFGASRDTIQQVMNYKEGAGGMIEKALNLLENPDGPQMEGIIKYNRDEDDEIGSNLLTRNQFIEHIEGQLGLLKNLAGIKGETKEEAMERLGMNSNK